MSSGIAITRPQAGSLPLFKHSENIASLSICEKPPKPQQPSPPQKTILESDLDKRLHEALKERDEQWRKHEKAQIVFLQNEGAAMLKSLHSEVERLTHHLRDAKRKLFVSHEKELSICDHSEMEKKITTQEEHIRQLEEIIKEKEAQAKNIESKVMMTIEKLQEQVSVQAVRIRQLSGELNDRNSTVAHLSSQLRAFRLRDAMATAQQRRRASQGGGSPLQSPSSPHRIFPPKGMLSASVTVSYPGSRSFVANEANVEGPGSIERPTRRKSASTLGIHK